MDDNSLKKMRILLVEDEQIIRESLGRFLERRVSKVVYAENGEEGLRLFNEFNPDVVITDIRMPKMDGLVLSRKIRQTSDVPIIITTGYNDENYLFSSIDVNIDKYLIKPVDNRLLEDFLIKTANNIELKKNAEKNSKLISDILDSYPGYLMITDGKKIKYMNRSFLEYLEKDPEKPSQEQNIELEKYISDNTDEFVLIDAFSKWISRLTAQPEFDHVVHMKQLDESPDEAGTYLVKLKKIDEDNNFLISFTDVTLMETIRLLFHELAIKDPMTRVFNRKKFFEELEKEIERSRRYKHELSIIMFDIDHFKEVNDRFGHQQGDRVLVEIVSLVKKLIRHNDVFARYGGEEFIVYLPETHLPGALHIAERLRQEMEDYDFDLGETITCSFGVAIYEDSLDVDRFVKLVDDALYKAKDLGRNRVERMFEDDLK